MTRIKQPQSGEHWWCEANSQSVVLMCQGLWNGQYQWACEYDDYIRPIARVQTLAEIEEIQSKIEKLTFVRNILFSAMFGMFLGLFLFIFF